MTDNVKRLVRNTCVATALVVVGLAAFTGAAAFGAGTIQANAATNLVQGQIVTVTGSGLAASTYGYVLECNETPGEPTVHVGAPFDQSIPIGCSAPSLKHLVSSTAAGTLSTTVAVHDSRRLGPPCNPSSVFGPCLGVDSSNKRPHADAQNYPCPPSPSQQTAGVTCALVFYDAAHEVVSTPIAFLGGGPSIKTPPTKTTATTAPKTTATTAPKTTATTAPKTTVTTSASPAPTLAKAPTIAVTSSSTGGSSSDPGTGSSSVVHASSGSLAFTGMGTPEKVLAVTGGLLVLLGLAMLFVNLRRIAVWLLGL